MYASQANLSNTSEVSRFNILSLDILHEIDSFSIDKLKAVFKKLYFKKEMINKNLWFIKTCLKENLTPIFLFAYGIKKLKVNDIINRKFISILLNSELKKWYSIRDNTGQYLKYIEKIIKNNLSTQCFDSFINSLKIIRDNKGKEKQKLLINKLYKLRMKNHNNIYKVNDTVAFQLNSSMPPTLLQQTSNAQENVNPDTTHPVQNFDSAQPQSPVLIIQSPQSALRNSLPLSPSPTLSEPINITSPTINLPPQLSSNLQNISTVEPIITDISLVHKFHCRTLFLTDNTISFTNAEIQLLNKGLKFAPRSPYNYHHLAKLAASIENSGLNSNALIECASILNKYIKASARKSNNELNSGSKDYKIMMNLQEKIMSNDLIVIKADKGYCSVVLHKIDYVNKVKEFLNKHNFSKLQADPTTNFDQRVRTALKETHFIFRTEMQKYACINMNASAPRLYGAPKIHKPNVPIRPVVSFCSSPCEKLSKALNRIINDFTNNFKAIDAIRNTPEFITEFRALHIPDSAILVSFDVADLFTSISPKLCLPLLTRVLNKSTANQLEIQELLSLVELCLEQNYFLFEGEYYSGPDGLAMGAPLSGISAEIFMHHFYKQFVRGRDNPYRKNILAWKRYVDDVFCIWNGTIEQLSAFISYLNECLPRIKFTFEIEINQSLNYLDLSVTRSNNKLSFGIYRKPTTTDSIIPYSSFHPWSHKMSAFHAFVHRLLVVPLDQNEYHKEVANIEHIAACNGYNTTIVGNIIRRHKRRQALSRIEHGDTHNNDMIGWRSLPYLGLVSERVGKVMRRHGFNVTYQNLNSLRGSLSHAKDKVTLKDKSGIYCLKCGDCGSTYVGQTGRSYITRIKEHFRKTTSRFFQHTNENDHKNASHEVAFLHTVNKGRTMNFLENVEISRYVKQFGDKALNKRGEGGVVTIIQDALAAAPRVPSVRYYPLDKSITSVS